jgi:hypothetical protein
MDENSIWSDLIKFRYGPVRKKFLDPEGVICSKMDSIWRRDVVSIGRESEYGSNWFAIIKPGDGETLRFWEDKWLGDTMICSEFEDLYRVAADCNISVAAEKLCSRDMPLRSWHSPPLKFFYIVQTPL